MIIVDIVRSSFLFSFSFECQNLDLRSVKKDVIVSIKDPCHPCCFGECCRRHAEQGQSIGSTIAWKPRGL